MFFSLKEKNRTRSRQNIMWKQVEIPIWSNVSTRTRVYRVVHYARTTFISDFVVDNYYLTEAATAVVRTEDWRSILCTSYNRQVIVETYDILNIKYNTKKRIKYVKRRSGSNGKHIITKSLATILSFLNDLIRPRYIEPTSRRVISMLYLGQIIDNNGISVLLNNTIEVNNIIIYI